MVVKIYAADMPAHFKISMLNTGWDGKMTETRINNFDLRWECYLPASQMYSVSGFYNSVDNPMELVRIPEQLTTIEYQPRNVGDGQLYGVELELRKILSFNKRVGKEEKTVIDFKVYPLAWVSAISSDFFVNLITFLKKAGIV